MKIKRKTEIEKPETVYNLHVKNDHNYIANGAVVHNCHGTKGNILRQMILEYGTTAKLRIGLTRNIA